MAQDRVRVAAHAKVNLFLRILARESPAGYHQIETAFVLLELADELVVTRTASGVALVVHGADVGPPEENLAVRAARAVLEATGGKFGVALELTKRIPAREAVSRGRGAYHDQFTHWHPRKDGDDDPPRQEPSSGLDAHAGEHLRVDDGVVDAGDGLEQREAKDRQYYGEDVHGAILPRGRHGYQCRCDSTDATQCPRLRGNRFKNRLPGWKVYCIIQI